MAKIKKTKEEIKGMGKEELSKQLETLREGMRAIKFKSEGSKSKNVKEVSFMKKQVARILTEINHAKGRASK